MKKILIILIIIFIRFCIQQEPPPSGGGGGGGGGGPPSCSASFSLTSTGKDTCTITSTITASYCDNKSYELKNGGTKCSGTIAGDSFSKTCDWTVSVGNYNYELYVNIDLKDSGPIVCKSSSKCSDETLYDSCSATKPLYCDGNGNLINKCGFCHCPTNQLCNITNEGCYPICSDNTPYGQCSVTKPLYCDNGNLINKCTQCECPSGKSCNSTTNSCYTPSQTCSDGTLYGQCSATKPKYCSSGTLINKCSQCSCPTNQNCNTTSEECYTALQCSSSVSLNLTPSTVQPSSSVIPSASGLASCDNKIVYFKKDSCSGTQVSSCTLTGGNCTGSSFAAPTIEGLYTYYACIDKNDDGDFSDSGEYSSKILNVTMILLLQSEIVHIDNSLEYLRSEYLKSGVPKVHDMAEYVVSKTYLGTQIPNKQQIIDYFDNNQNQTDGSWKGVNTPMFTTHRVLLAYYILNATPNRSLDSFFSNYDTWEEALAYDLDNHYNKFDGRDIYHIVLGWFLYYRTYPTWLNDFFTKVEEDLTWTNSTNSHKRTHTLYSYVMARRQFPNLDGIINETLKEQSSDGHWDYQCLSTPRPVYCNAIQLVLLQQIIKLYPNHRTAEIQSSIDRSRQWVYDTYNTTTVDGVIMGHFGTSTSIEDAVMVGIMSAGINGLMDINVDMAFEDLIGHIS